MLILLAFSRFGFWRGWSEKLQFGRCSEKFLLIDVREDNEWAEGHVPGAIHIGRGVLEKGIEEKAVDGKTPIVLYCHSGARSALAADTLQKMGYTNVASMAGGTSAWREKGFPLEK